MTRQENRAAIVEPTTARQSLALLIFVGLLLALNVLFSKQAAVSGAAMLWYLTVSLGGAGFFLILLAAWRGEFRRGPPSILPYSAGAGALLAAGMACGYLSVGRVGAAFVALAMAFPTLLTYLMSIAIGMERSGALRLLGVAAGLTGGVLLAEAKGGATASSDRMAILATCLMPVVLAAGNIFRSRFWPRGATPLLLAGPMLLCAAIATLPFAIWNEGGAFSTLWAEPAVSNITTAATLSFTLQYVAFFRLQQIAGPVYLSQIGSVAAISGTILAVIFLGERLPDGFAGSALMISLGIILFHLTDPPGGSLWPKS